MPVDTEEKPYQYSFRIKCTSCQSEHPNEISFTRFDSIPTTTGKSNVNYIQKCRSCQKQLSIDIIKGPQAYMLNDPPTEQPIIKFDTKGCDVLAFVPGKGHKWQAEGAETGSKFEDIDFGEIEDEGYSEYDERALEEVGITEAEFTIVNAKKFKTF
ncbi:hypothetical protein BJ508DRAFT_409943 [Ascobolus immersus RN42]|uniref:DUF866-domain-containing protein n=1 Tax=Ascobolus immersus RN42 TaxID=1160509 RepID=A0A3N4IRH6_ASCIM|nr:hypothetical protein BJ508DRAFT_409943 [Ascobolus immersus RN42]